MGVKNYLIEGVSGTGKSSVCQELRRRGYDVVDGDKELAYQGDPETGEKTEGHTHQLHIWNEAKVRKIASDHTKSVTYFCGGSRNFSRFLDVFDRIYILDVDEATLNDRLDSRDGWGKEKSERELVLRLHESKEDLPQDGIEIDATEPLSKVVDKIISSSEA